VQRLTEAASLPATEGYAAARAAVLDLLHETVGLPASGATDGVLRQALRDRGAADAVIEALLADLHHCDYARYAPGESRQAELQPCCQRLAETVSALATALAHTPAPAARGAMLRGSGGLLVALSLGQLATATDLHAAPPDATFAAANQAYVGGDAVKAADGYRALLALGTDAPAVHYNLANALYQQRQLGRAVAHYLLALRHGATGTLQDDASSNLAAARTALAEQARRRHETLHIFDESPEADVALARAAPRDLLAALALLAGWTALVLAIVLMRGRGGWATQGSLVAVLLVHCGSLLWLLHAHRTDASVVHAVVVQEDAPLGPCQGVGDSIGLPEGIEVRRLRELADGRLEVRMTNGRQGCVAAAALQVLE
jgi:hypothetical protein